MPFKSVGHKGSFCPHIVAQSQVMVAAGQNCVFAEEEVLDEQVAQIAGAAKAP